MCHFLNVFKWNSEILYYIEDDKTGWILQGIREEELLKKGLKIVLKFGWKNRKKEELEWGDGGE